MMRSFWRLLLLCLLCVCGTVHARVLTLGVLAVYPKSEEQMRWQALADYLTQSLQVQKVELRVLNFAEMQQQLQNYELDFLITNPSHYVSLHENNALVEVIATLVQSEQEQAVSAYGGVIFCLATRNDINSLLDIADKKIAVVNRASFAGYQIQRYELEQLKIPLQDAHLLKMEMPHENVVHAVLSGQAEVGFVRTGVLEHLIRNHQLDVKQLKILNAQKLGNYPFLLSSRLYPEWPIVALPSVEPALVRKAMVSLLQLEPKHPAMLSAGIYGFTVPNNYRVVEDLLRDLRLPPFDKTPEFTLTDVWLRYRQPLLVLLITGTAIILLFLLLLVKNRQLYVAQQQIHASQQRFKLLVDKMPIPLAFSHQQGNAAYFNERFIQIFGYRSEEIQNINAWMELAYPNQDYRQWAYHTWSKAVAAAMVSGLDISPVEYQVTCKNGAVRIMEVSGVVLGDDLLATFIDLTERKQNEVELEKYRNQLEQLVEERTVELIKAKEAAEAANIAKSTFIATMSHELRTPLNAILGFSELLSLDENVTAQQKLTLGIINRSGLHLLSMINDVLEISKIETGHLELDPKAFDLLDLFEDLNNMFSIRAANKELSFTLNIANDLPQYIKADSIKLRQILINLLGNALKFTHQGGVILEAHTQKIHNAIQLMMSVSDTGIGISCHKQQQLFKPFVQLARTDNNVEGTGLGLTISKSLIELMGGQLTVASTEGLGTTFSLSIPILQAEASDIAVKTPTRLVKGLAQNQPLWRLLVVDDNADNRLLLLSLLVKVGFDVLTADHGQEAVKAFERWHPHLILMDMRMPIMDGYQATANIRQLKGGDSVKIIAVSASAFKEQHEKMFQAGCDAIINKPIQTQQVFDMLAKMLNVQFIYQESDIEKTVTLTNVYTLPLALRQQLFEAAQNLDVEETEQIIDKIAENAPDIAHGLRVLLQQFQFEQILKLLQNIE